MEAEEATAGQVERLFGRDMKNREREQKRKTKKTKTKACLDLSLVTLSRSKKEKKKLLFSLSNLLKIRKIKQRKNVYKYYLEKKTVK